MGRKTKAPPTDAFTPTRRSARINVGPVKETPGQRFRNLVEACSDFVPVAEDISHLEHPLDDVLVSPPATKRKKLTTTTKSVHPAESSIAAAPAAFAAENNLAAAAAAFDAAAASDANNLFDSDSSESENDSDDVSVGNGGDDRKMLAQPNARKMVKDRMASIEEEADEEELGDAGMASIEEEADEEELGDAGGECQGDGLLGEQIAQADPSSLFLHDDEDMGALMSFFADDSNYNNVEREPEVRIDNT